MLGCGAELDDDFTVTKSGDAEAEAEARAAKAAARAARAAAKKPKKKPAAKKRSHRAQDPQGAGPQARGRTEREEGVREQHRGGGVGVSSFADEVAALRGTRPATFRDLITHPAFSKLLAAQTVSSFGDWVGFVAVTALVASKGGRTAAPTRSPG